VAALRETFVRAQFTLAGVAVNQEQRIQGASSILCKRPRFHNASLVD
jgi:hypothetical protein